MAGIIVGGLGGGAVAAAEFHGAAGIAAVSQSPRPVATSAAVESRVGVADAAAARLLERARAAIRVAGGVTYTADVWTESGSGRVARMRNLDVVIGDRDVSDSPILVRPFRIRGAYAPLPRPASSATNGATATATTVGDPIDIAFDGTRVRTLRPSAQRIDERRPWDAMPEPFAALLPGWVQRGELELRKGDRATLGAADRIDGVPCRAVSIERAAGRGVRISDRIWFADADGLPRRFERESRIDGLNQGRPLRTVVAARDLSMQRTTDASVYTVTLPEGWQRTGPATEMTATPIAPPTRATEPTGARSATATETTASRNPGNTGPGAGARPGPATGTPTATPTDRPATRPATRPVRVTGTDAPSRPAAPRKPDRPLADGTPAPDFALKTPDGETVTLKSLRGRVVLLDFWATWCGPCKLAMPGLQELQTRLGERGLTVVGMNQRETGDPAAYMAENDVDYTLLLDADDVAERFGVRGMPHVVLIDRAGVIRFTQVGYAPGHIRSLRLVAEGLLNERPASDDADADVNAGG